MSTLYPESVTETSEEEHEIWSPTPREQMILLQNTLTDSSALKWDGVRVGDKETVDEK